MCLVDDASVKWYGGEVMYGVVTVWGEVVRW